MEHTSVDALSLIILTYHSVSGDLDISAEPGTECYATVKVEDLKARSDALAGRRPEWHQEFFFEVSTEMDLGVEIEIWEKGFLWDRILGMIIMPYASIRFVMG